MEIKREKEIAYVIEPLFQGDDLADKLAEICELISSAGAEVYGNTAFTVREIIPSAFVGSGKLAEILSEIEDTPVNTVVFDGELSPSQTLNMSAALGGVKVIDRTTLILDIFALNALSSEGKLQVELAQLKYIYPRLKGKGEALSRLGGGIGTRGPGETKLETDRRHIRARINSLEEKLKELETRRDLQMRRRERNSCPTVALVGYTNTGKSTLLNALTGADAFVKNQLFATLDPTVRKLNLDGAEVLLIDTVGFVRNIPHHIIEAFKSTLELAVRADLILNVCDGGNERWRAELETTLSTLSEFDYLPEILTVINKRDKITDFSGYPKDAIFVSAKEGKGLDDLKKAISDKLSATFTVLDLRLGYSSLSAFNKAARYADKTEYSYGDEFVEVKATVKNAYIGKFSEFVK